MIMSAGSAELSQLTLPALVELGEYALCVVFLVSWLGLLYWSYLSFLLLPATDAKVHLLVISTLQQELRVEELSKSLSPGEGPRQP